MGLDILAFVLARRAGLLAWRLKPRRLTFTKSETYTDTSEYSILYGDLWRNLFTATVKGLPPGAAFVVLGARFKREMYTPDGTPVYTRIVIADVGYCEGSTTSTSYVTVENICYMEQPTQVGTDGGLTITVQGKYPAASGYAHARNFEIEVWGVAYEPEA